jgi:hypothetical protein
MAEDMTGPCRSAVKGPVSENTAHISEESVK